MAQGLLAFGAPANIIQFVDFSSKILSTGYRIHKSSRSSTQESQELEHVTIDLKKVTDDLDSAIQEDYASTNDSQLQQLAESCKTICVELLKALEQLHGDGKPQKWQSFRTALKTVWSEGRIQALQKRIEQFRQEIIVRILLSLRYQDLLPFGLSQFSYLQRPDQ